MPRTKKRNPTVIKSLEELISDYDKKTLIDALNSFKSHNVGWMALRAILMKEYINHAGTSMDYSSQSGKQIEAAYEAGVAQTLYDVATVVIDTYVDRLENGVQVTQSPRPEE